MYLYANKISKKYKIRTNNSVDVQRSLSMYKNILNPILERFFRIRYCLQIRTVFVSVSYELLHFEFIFLYFFFYYDLLSQSIKYTIALTE